MILFKSTEYAVHFFEPTDFFRSMYSMGNEVLIASCADGMNDFKSCAKDFINYLLVTSSELKNRLDKLYLRVLQAKYSFI